MAWSSGHRLPAYPSGRAGFALVAERKRCPKSYESGDGRSEQGFHGFVLTMVVLLSTFTITCVAQFDTEIVPSDIRARLSSYQVLWPQKWVFFTGGLDKDEVVAYRTEASGRLA